MIGGVLRERRRGGLEAQLPSVLRPLSVELNMGIAFEKALEHSLELAEGGMRSELERVLSEVRAGSGISCALNRFAERSGSTPVRRAVSQMVLSYEKGEGGASLRRLADDLVREQRAKEKEHSSKAALGGLLFTSVSCIVPALFLTYVTVGSAFMGSTLTPLEVWLFFTVGFPAFSLLVIGFLELRAPARASGLAGFFSEGERARVEKVLRKRGWGRGLKSFFYFSFALGALFSFSAALSYSPPSGWEMFYYSVLLAGLCSPALAYTYLAFLVRKRDRGMELFLPDALFQAASLQGRLHFEKLFSVISGAGYGPLSEEFSAAGRQVRAGASVPQALRGIAKRSGSRLVSRAVLMVERAYVSGHEVQEALRDTAEDVFDSLSSLREARAASSMQRYTLLAAAGVFVPVVLGLVSGLVSGLELGMVEGFSAVSEEARAELVEAGVGASKAYLLLFVAITCFFVSRRDGEGAKAVVYLAAVAPLALALFKLASDYSCSQFA